MRTASLASACSVMKPAENDDVFFSSRDRKSNLRRWCIALFAVCFSGLMTACSSESTKPAEPAKPEVKGPELLTARSAFQKLYVAARGWNQDARPYRLESVVTSDANGRDGKW